MLCTSTTDIYCQKIAEQCHSRRTSSISKENISLWLECRKSHENAIHNVYIDTEQSMETCLSVYRHMSDLLTINVSSSW